jgi:hypothetical protein
MMAFQFLTPIIASVLYVMVFQKAGFKGAILAVCAGPVVGAILTHLMIGMMMSGGFGPGMMLLPLISIPFALAPLLVLAFKSWPPVAAPTIRSEK